VSEVVFHVFFWIFLTGLIGVSGAALFIFVFAYVKGRPKKRLAMDGEFPSERIALLEKVAQTYGGTVVNDPARYRFPFFRAAHDGRPWAVALAPWDDATRDATAAYIVRFEAPLAGRRFVEAWPLGSPYPPLRMASPEVKLGAPSFDAGHVIRTDDAAHARSILAEPVRELLAKMQSIGNGGRVRFDLFPYKLQLQKEEMLADYGGLYEFTRQAMVLLGEVKAELVAQAGVEFFDDAPASRERPVCPVCGAAIAASPASCVRCRTPHHADCWKYFGMCSMFACGERRYAL
jgi:hypothetical protein